MKPWSHQAWPLAAGAYSGFCSMKRLEVFHFPWSRRSLPRNFIRFPQQFAGTHLYTWVERGTVRVKRLAQEHNTMFLARARTRTVRSGVERTNHEATAPPTLLPVSVTLTTSENPTATIQHGTSAKVSVFKIIPSKNTAERGQEAT